MPGQVPGNEQAIIRVENLEHAYGTFKAVDGIKLLGKKR